MATKKRKTTKRTSGGTGSKARTRSAVGVIDVTDDSAEVVIAQVKLLCDNDTEVVFTRAGDRLVMRRQDRE
jgi:hypothetical protein